MKALRPVVAILGVSFLVPILLIAGEQGQRTPHWAIKGDLSEACTCNVPCPCNFSSHPSQPHCWSVASLYIQRGHYGRVRLNGLHLVRGHGKDAIVWYLDDRASAAQAAALRKIAEHISAPLIKRNPSFVHFEKAHLTQSVGNRGSEVSIADRGGFEADYLTGGDGRNPIVVQNMTAWNIQHDIKGRTRRLHYKDKFGNDFDVAGTNANQGKFDWTDHTAWYL